MLYVSGSELPDENRLRPGLTSGNKVKRPHNNELKISWLVMTRDSIILAQQTVWQATLQEAGPCTL